ncbi:MAG: site-2 protease family protein [Acidobacteria bacterium]|nr:site-2 protease family protein [Acidobacteriota bacterium]
MSFPSDDPGYPGATFPLEPFDASFAVPVRRRKFQSRLWLHAVLLLLTIVSTTIAGTLHYYSFMSEFSAQQVQWQWSLLLHGFWYSGTLLGILGAHEMGHYLLCRRYNVDATLPYFIPMPPLLFLTGTLGAVIKIREAFPPRKVLFDIGVAGPIAGFVVLVPALFYGMTLSNVVPEPTQGSILYLGEPLLFKLATFAIIGPVREGYTVNIHPMVFAAWFGMLATALNLLPFGQLDGGHITYATLGRWSTPISIATVASAIAMTFISMSWLVMTVMMLVMLVTLGPRHPRVIYEHEPLGLERNLIAVFALIMFILCFTPVPIQLQDLVGGR